MGVLEHASGAVGACRTARAREWTSERMRNQRSTQTMLEGGPKETLEEKLEKEFL